MGEGWDSGHDHLVPLLAGVVSWFLDLRSPYLVMHVSLVAHNITAWCPSVVLLQSLWKCQGCASRSWGARPGGTGTVRAEPACVCVSVVCIHNTHGCFFSLPPPLSLSLFLLPTLLLAHAGRAHLSGLSQPKLDFCSCVFSFVCFFFFPPFTCPSLSVSLAVPHAPAQLEGGPQPSSSQGLTWYPAAARSCSRPWLAALHPKSV